MMSELVRRKEWYTVDIVYENGLMLCHKHYDKVDAVKEFYRKKKEFRNSDGGHIRLSYHIEQIECIKDILVLGKGRS